MPNVTARGRELYLRVQRRLTDDHDFYEALGICSLIARHEPTYARIQENWCSVEMNERQEDALRKREVDIERRVTDLAASLPTPYGPMEVHFEGDPRGCVIKLVVPGNDPDQQWIGVG